MAGAEILKIQYAPTIAYDFSKFQIRPVIKGDTNKGAVLFYGCSYTYGSKLNENQTLPYKFAKLTNRTVYNRAIEGAGPQQMLYDITTNKKVYDGIKKADFAIYTFINDHLHRQYYYTYVPFPIDEKNFMADIRYKLNKNYELELINPKYVFLYSSYIIKRIQDYIIEKNVQNPESFILFKAILDESRFQLQKRYPNIRFVIIEYKDTGAIIFDKETENIFKNDSYIVFEAEELAGHELMSSKWRLDDKEHPSEAAWDDIVPNLVKKLRLLP